MSTQVPSLGIAILSLLDERDMHPYEMMQTLRARKEDRWVKVSPGSLYHQVERLVALALAEVAGVTQEGNRPPRTTYRITPAGRDILTEWVTEHLHTVEEPYLPVSLALGEIASLKPQEAASTLTERKVALDEQIHELNSFMRDAHNSDGLRIFLLAHEHKHAMLTTERDFVTSLITDIESGELAWPKQ